MTEVIGFRIFFWICEWYHWDTCCTLLADKIIILTKCYRVLALSGGLGVPSPTPCDGCAMYAFVHFVLVRDIPLGFGYTLYQYECKYFVRVNLGARFFENSKIIHAAHVART